jgi:ribosomal protein S18 acetylase RimI-like enzyme
MKDIGTIKILRATPEDAPGIQKVTELSSREMYRLCGLSDQEIDDHFDTAEGEEKLRKNILNFSEADILLTAKDGSGKIIGFCYANKGDEINRIEAMYILTEFQGSGLAKKLYDTAYENLNPKNDTLLDVFSLNLKGVNFYRKMGFNETGKKSFEERFKDSAGNMLEITEMKLEKKHSLTV